MQYLIRDNRNCRMLYVVTTNAAVSPAHSRLILQSLLEEQAAVNQVKQSARISDIRSSRRENGREGGRFVNGEESSPVAGDDAVKSRCLPELRRIQARVRNPAFRPRTRIGNLVITVLRWRLGPRKPAPFLHFVRLRMAMCASWPWNYTHTGHPFGAQHAGSVVPVE